VGQKHPDVELRIPADSAYLAVLRTATAGLAARLDFTLDDIEDLRIAVDEACALLLPHALEGSSLECAFDLSPDALAVTVSVPTSEPVPIAQDSFAWTVLTALVGDVTSKETDDGVMLSLVKRRVSTS
jgi:serine/threonine-protein kinase RsbW